MPKIVVIGVSAGRSACRRIVSTGDSPLARAVRMKFSASVSMTLALVSRA